MLHITGTAQTVRVSSSLGGRRGLSCLEFKNGGWLFGYLQLRREFPDGGKIQREQEEGSSCSSCAISQLRPRLLADQSS